MITTEKQREWSEITKLLQTKVHFMKILSGKGCKHHSTTILLIQKNIKWTVLKTGRYKNLSKKNQKLYRKIVRLAQLHTNSKTNFFSRVNTRKTFNTVSQRLLRRRILTLLLNVRKCRQELEDIKLIKEMRE